MLTHGSGTGAGCPEHVNKTQLIKLSSYDEHESNYLRFLLNRVTKFYFAVHFHSFMMDRLTDELPEHWRTKSMEPKFFFSIQFHQKGLDGDAFNFLRIQHFWVECLSLSGQP